MSNTPRLTIEDAVLQSQACAICGEQTLRVAHVDRLPDYVSCSSCGSVFVMEEGGERVMYGKIPAEYPQTAEVALRNWLMPEDIQGHAMGERPGSQMAPADEERIQPATPSMASHEPARAASHEVQGEPASEDTTEEKATLSRGRNGQEPAARFHALLRSYEEAPQPPVPEEGTPETQGRAPEASWADLAKEFDVPEPDVLAPSGAIPPMMESLESPSAADSAASAAPIREVSPPASTDEQPLGTGVEPPPGARYRVSIKGNRLRIPRSSCAHCLRIPAGRTLTVLAPTPPGAQRRVVRLAVPLCHICFRRANARSPEESGAKLQAHLISALVALLLVISTLGVGIVNLQEDPGIGALVLLILAVVGYGVPAFFLLGRSNRFPPPADALYVRSTLVIYPEVEPAGLTFSWRNQGFADLFYDSNSKAVEGPVVQVSDQPEAETS